MNSEQLRKEFESWAENVFNMVAKKSDNSPDCYSTTLATYAWKGYEAAATKRDKLIEELLSDLEDAHPKYPPRSLRKAELMGYGA